jgi:uncharacterized protein YbjT (DUF2867 family)
MEPSSPTSDDRPTVAIAGATGFVGTAVREALADTHNIIALTRSPVRAQVNASPDSNEEWRHCDLFSPHSVREGLKGADYAIYLVHSMLPSARLTQANFADLDLLLADNFARAAEARGVEQILYVGGLVPDDAPLRLAPRLASRLEVEHTLGSGAAALTALRAGLIVGPGGTWLRMMINLVERLPMMVLPQWTEAVTQPIALDDMVRALKHCLGREATYDQHFDVGGPDVMTYRELLERTADVLGRKRWMATAPVSMPGTSKLWVRAFSGAPWALVSPLIDSLRFSATVEPNPLQEWLRPEAQPYEEALRQSVDEEGEQYPNPREDLRDADDAVIRSDSVARSVQRLPLPKGFTAHDVANEYMRWLPRFGWPFLKCTVSKGRRCRFILRPFNTTLLELRFDPDRSLEGRQLFYVTGGWLADTAGVHEGRLEFRRALNGRCIIAAVHDFAPRLPWYLYNVTQAIAHLFVMYGFGRHLRDLAAERSDGTRRTNGQMAPGAAEEELSARRSLASDPSAHDEPAA